MEQLINKRKLRGTGSLRFISVLGIAIAMVIGFIAISKQMKDDFTVRSRVVDVLKQMKDLAEEELQCQAEPNHDKDDSPAVEISQETDITALVDDEGQAIEQSSDAEETIAETEDRIEDQSSSDDLMERTEAGQNADVIKTMGYRILESGAVEVIVIFNNVKGDSGKTHIKPGSRLAINCGCVSKDMSCKTVESNINKNYLPKLLTKPQT